MANGKLYCNSSTLRYLNPCLFHDSLCPRFWDWSVAGNVVDLGLTFHWVEDTIGLSHYYCNLFNQPVAAFPNFFFSQTGSLMFLWPHWACANTAQGKSTKRQHLLWVYSTERTETRLHFIFIFVCLFLFSCFFKLLDSYSF